ncbi:MAG: DNA adenine methylase [Actinomycetota bacterium]|nr:DNA adenine methylase [Actinomycetota bacterium]
MSQLALAVEDRSTAARATADASLAARLARYPRLRFMGSKFRLAPRLARLFETLPAGPVLDAFSGSGVVSYTLKATGRPVLASDHLTFASTLAEATVANDDVRLDATDVALLCSGNRDGRDFIARTFAGLYFPDDDHRFVDGVWSHIEDLDRPKQALAIGALCLAAAWKQPRGVFSFATPRYDDGRRQLRMPLHDLFHEAVATFNGAVFEGTSKSRTTCQDVFDLEPEGFSVVYLDPPYAPPRDDTCYIKRYHFLEGLATYWRGQEILWETKTRKIAKRWTPFAYKRTVRPALDQLFDHFKDSTLVVSYGSNASLSGDDLGAMLARHKRRVERIEIPHRYAFGTHAAASRRMATEFIFVAR